MKNYTPTPEMRTNPLSNTPGGSTVLVRFENHEITYTNIKNPGAYIKKVRSANEGIREVFVNGVLWK